MYRFLLSLSLSLSLPAMPLMTVSEKSRLLSVGFRTEAVAGVELSKNVFTSRVR
jgi:hypothetical protein